MAHSGGAGNSGTSNQKALPRGVLARSGLPLPAGARLSSSIRAPRDLTLGGKVGGLPKKSLAPNLTPKSSTSTSAANNSEGRGNVRRRFGPRGEDGEYCGRGYRDGSGTRRRGGADSSRGRGRGKGVHQNLVQLDGNSCDIVCD
ncbi:DNA-directed RNA polymerase III subunit RPC4-like [Tropilaelaps mercedesae]|uniref:DNA-directed RNA polymerase III subunit RPC4-like n=1 Tax=Tropilaelaps mercedesae TaxID=418985 RepID=A0A1V9XM31_9ACAR|nr:DNA-directed RNA polymerase III subunit RPC4-like [Tropilaelaps mercedesae]